ncbi:MAG: Holliday junction branch migration protein RuvA [Elusimicrobia bacterium]|nr:Holliday junction branch migration protein RuvA [Elusimicrobiota bacterium]
MIATLRGPVVERDGARVIVEAGGVGYEVSVTPHTASRLPAPGSPAFLHVCESTALYGGGTTLYGFLSSDEKALFLLLREIPGTGAKKALEALDKASRSQPEFLRALAANDVPGLVKVFGFSRKTAEKMVAALKDKVGLPSAGPAPRYDSPTPASGPQARALEALAALGYKPAESRLALDSVARDLEGREAAVEELVRLSLRRL